MIKVDHLSKTFGHRRVLQSLELSVGRGEIVALIGMNGAGKTTLVRTLATLSRPDAGSVHINGVSTTRDPITVRRNIGVVLHAPMLYPNLTCKENLHFYSRLYALDAVEKRISALLAAVDLESRTGDRVSTFSRGMQQRLSIARAMLHDPQCLLLDEVFTGLDQGSSALLDDLLKQKAKEGNAILFTTHDIERIFNLASRVDILHRGKIIFSIPVKSINPQQLSDLYQEFTSESANAPLRGAI